jgi:hypothetical protein
MIKKEKRAPNLFSSVKAILSLSLKSDSDLIWRFIINSANRFDGLFRANQFGGDIRIGNKKYFWEKGRHQ